MVIFKSTCFFEKQFWGVFQLKVKKLLNVLISYVYECAFCGDALISIYVSSAVNDNFITKAEHWNISVVSSWN